MFGATKSRPGRWRSHYRILVVSFGSAERWWHEMFGAKGLIHQVKRRNKPVKLFHGGGREDKSGVVSSAAPQLNSNVVESGQFVSPRCPDVSLCVCQDLRKIPSMKERQTIRYERDGTQYESSMFVLDSSHYCYY